MLAKKKSGHLDNVFHALSNKTRRDIIELLCKKPNRPVSGIAASFDMSLPAISKHLNVLQTSGLLKRHKVGRNIFCSIDPSQIKTAADFLKFYSQFWPQQLDNLQRFVEDKSHGQSRRENNE